jgi:hypothetical protein
LKYLIIKTNNMLGKRSRTFKIIIDDEGGCVVENDQGVQ